MILFVDDETGVLQSLQRLFHREPYMVFTASSGKEALEMLARLEDVAVIISDQRMPEMGGTEFLIKSRELAPDAIRMLLTGYSDFQETVDAMNDGATTRFISKPWNGQELLHLVRDAVKEYENKKAARVERQALVEQLEVQREMQEELVRSHTQQIEQLLEDMQLQARQQQDSYRTLLGALAGLIDLNVMTSRHHAANTAFLSVGIATGLGLPPHVIDDIQMAALLHDIGKNVFSDDMLDLPPEGMTDTQLALYNSHPMLGQSMIETVADLKDIAMMVRHHHEWYDGSGFPDGLGGADIPLGAAIISLANALDLEMGFNKGALAFPVSRVLDKLKLRVGTEFDPRLFSHIEKPALELYGGTTHRVGRHT